MVTEKEFMKTIDVPFSIISIVSPEYPEYKVEYSPYCRDTLYLRFHDERANGSISSLYAVKKAKGIDDSDARKIIEFGLKNKKHKNFMIHCEAGLSRSPAVALALSEILNDDEGKHFKNMPQQYVETLYDIRHHNFDVKKKILEIYYEEYKNKTKEAKAETF